MKNKKEIEIRLAKMNVDLMKAVGDLVNRLITIVMQIDEDEFLSASSKILCDEARKTFKSFLVEMKHDGEIREWLSTEWKALDD